MHALAAGLTASGADAYLLHVTTTPSVSYVVRTEDFDCGIMISASHNPFYDNGIKVINSAGHKLEAEVEEKIEAYIDGEIGELPLATKEKIGRTVDYAAGRNRYIGHLISVATRSFKDIFRIYRESSLRLSLFRFHLQQYICLHLRHKRIRRQAFSLSQIPEEREYV